MKNHLDSDQQPTPETAVHRQLARRMRLVGKLMRLDISKVVHENPAVTRGEAKAASRSLDERITTAVSPDELATTLETLDKLAEALGGPDALPFFAHSNRRGRRLGRGHRHQSEMRHGRAQYARGQYDLELHGRKRHGRQVA